MTSIQATQNMITIQPLYKWDSEESQMTYLNLYPRYKKLSYPRLFFQGSPEHTVRSFSWPYVEPPSKSTTASNDLRLDDDAIEIETSEIAQQQQK